jgi:hypothetical protein
MKRILLALAVLGLPWLALGQSNVVVGSYADFGQNPQTGRRLYMYPLWLPSVSPSGITTLDRRTLVTDAVTGQASTANVLAGLYRGEFQGTWQPTTNWFTIPATNGTIYLSNCVASSYVLAGSTIPAYSQPQADARFALIGSGVGSTGGVSVVGSGPIAVATSNGVATVRLLPDPIFFSTLTLATNEDATAPEMLFAPMDLHNSYGSIYYDGTNFYISSHLVSDFKGTFSGDGAGLTNLSGGAGTNYTAGNGIVITGNSIALYSAPTISGFVNDQNTVEIGATVSSTVLTWTLAGGSIAGQSMNQGIGAMSTSLRTTNDTASYSTGRTYTLTVTDGTTTNTASTSVAFENKRYWGVNAATNLSDAQIRSLTNGLTTALSQEFATGYQKAAFVVSPSAQYFYYVFPDAWGSASFFDPLQDTSFALSATRDFVNGSGNHTTNKIYRSSTPLTGTYTISVQ